MASQFAKAVTTSLGRALMAAALSEEKAIEFTAVKTGNGVYPDSEKTTAALEAMTALKSTKQSFGISGITHFSDYVTKITSVLSNAGLEEAYNWNEVGVFARLEGTSDTPVLYSIAVVASGTGTEIPAYSSTTVLDISQSFYLQISNAVPTTILVNHDTCELLEDAGLNADLETEAKDTLVNAINEVSKLSREIEQMINSNRYYAAITDENGNNIVDDDGNRILGDWKYKVI
jgi:hypothetical protein